MKDLVSFSDWAALFDYFQALFEEFLFCSSSVRPCRISTSHHYYHQFKNPLTVLSLHQFPANQLLYLVLFSFILSFSFSLSLSLCHFQYSFSAFSLAWSFPSSFGSTHLFFYLTQGSSCTILFILLSPVVIYRQLSVPASSPKALSFSWYIEFINYSFLPSFLACHLVSLFTYFYRAILFSAFVQFPFPLCTQLIKKHLSCWIIIVVPFPFAHSLTPVLLQCVV